MLLSSRSEVRRVPFLGARSLTRPAEFFHPAALARFLFRLPLKRILRSWARTCATRVPHLNVPAALRLAPCVHGGREGAPWAWLHPVRPRPSDRALPLANIEPP